MLTQQLNLVLYSYLLGPDSLVYIRQLRCLTDEEGLYLTWLRPLLDGEKPRKKISWLDNKPSFFNRLGKLRSSVKNHVEKWRDLYYSNSPQSETFPQPLDKLSGLERLAVLRCLRPDKVLPAIQAFIVTHMSQRYVEPSTFNLLQSWKDSTPTSPLVFILSPGSDPMAALVTFAEAQGKSKALQVISLGQGQVWFSD